jgi:hypothetical protein
MKIQEIKRVEDNEDKGSLVPVLKVPSPPLSDADLAFVNRELNAEEALWRARGRPVVGQIQPRRAIVPMRRKAGLPAVWNQLQVIDRLEEAYEILARLPMTTRPKGHGNAMPAYVHDFSDMVAQGETGELERMARTRNDYRVRGATSAEIARMESALHWPSKYLADMPEVARAVQLGALWAAMKVDARRRLKARGINPKIFGRRKMHGLNVITLGLIRDKVPVS